MKIPRPFRFHGPGKSKGQRTWIDPLEVAEKLARIEPGERLRAFANLENERILEIFQALKVAHQEEIIEGLNDEQARYLVEEIDPDDRVRLLAGLPEPIVEKLLSGLSLRERRYTLRLLSYPEESAGRIMSPEFLELKPTMTVAEALAEIRKRGAQVETIHTLPVLDHEERLLGMVELSELVLAAPDQMVADVMDEELRAVATDDDQEAVARLLQAADLLAVPVVDDDGRLLGLVTVDDAMDVLTREEEEDYARAGGAEPLRRPYFSVSDFRLARSRIVWLVVLIIAATLTVQVLKLFEQTLDNIVALALFIPLLIGTGGNAGAQSSTTVVRSMALGDVQPSDFLRTVWREAKVGLMLGAMLGLLAYLPVWLLADPSLALVVSLTLVSICTLASMVGSMMPLLAQSLGVDPAVASAPFVTTIVDATGLLVYFLIAQTVLPLG